MRNYTSGYAGRYQLGDVVPLVVTTVDNFHTPGVPDATPVAKLYSDAGVLVAAIPMPIDDKAHVAGRFRLPLRLGPGYSAGHYRVLYSYVLGGASYVALGRFEVTGGDAGGSVISMVSYNRPEARFVVAQTTGERLVSGRGPSV